MPKVSIIVPIYNSENTLSRCVDSILAQTDTDFELILIDDGSQDNSGIICDDYAKKNSRVVVIHKENGGASSARNKGLEIANGKYITFVDSDDTISTNYLSSFSYCADFEIAGLETIESTSEVDFPDNKILLVNTSDIYDWFILNSHRKYLTSVCSKLFLSEKLKSSSLKFDISLKYGEDTVFIYSYLSYCRSINLFQNVIYQYHVNSSIWDKKYSLNAIDCVNHLFSITNSLKYIEQNWKYILPNKLKTAHYPTYLHLFYTHLKSLSKEEKIVELKTFRKNSNKLQLWNALNIKNYLYWRILPLI